MAFCVNCGTKLTKGARTLDNVGMFVVILMQPVNATISRRNCYVIK
jgi:hypothetical protein